MWTAKQQSLLMGSLLGDGWVSKPRNRAAFMGIQHGASQLEYLAWKKARFEQAGFTVSRIYDVSRAHASYLVHVGLGAKGVALRAVLYPEGRKSITREMVDVLDAEGLAIWYLDDGSMTHKRRNGVVKGREMYVCTNSFTAEEHEMLTAYLLDRWDVEARVRDVSGYLTLKINATNAKKLRAIILPHTPPSMRYKLDFQYVAGR